MSFSDKDLKRLMADYESFCTEALIEALLARLEAAEAVIKASFNHKGMAHIGLDHWHEAHEAWLKSKGA